MELFLGNALRGRDFAAYVGESLTLRYDPRDVAEIRVFHEKQFLCRAICPELAGATIPIPEIVRARNKRRLDLQATVRDRQRTVDELMEIKRGDARINKEVDEIPGDFDARCRSGGGHSGDGRKLPIAGSVTDSDGTHHAN